MHGLRDRLFSPPPHSPPYVLENMAVTRRLRLGSVFHIEVMATPTVFMQPVWIVALGLLVSFVAHGGESVGERLLVGIAYAALTATSMLGHYLGGALAGWLCRAPMRWVVFTATLIYAGYDESREYPSWVHLARGLGEPVTNLIIGAVTLSLYLAGMDSRYLLFLGILNLVFFVVAMTPLPTMHGGVVVQHLKNWKKG